MSYKDKLYTAGSIIFIALAGAIVFYLIRDTKTNNQQNTTTNQNNLAQTASDQAQPGQQNTDGSINATNLQINPQRPSGGNWAGGQNAGQ